MNQKNMDIIKGDNKIKWVAKHMPILAQLHNYSKKEQPFKGVKVGICLHIEAKTGYLVNVLADGGAQIALCGSNPLTTQNCIVDSLMQRGIEVYSRKGMNNFEYVDNIRKVAEFCPDLIIDDGADLTCYLYEHAQDKLKKIIAGTEETTTGIIRLRKMHSLLFPIMAVNDTPMKCMFDNRFGTAQSTLAAFLNVTNMSISGKVVVICGYGWCGRGLASRAKGLGASVIICEVNYIKANEALLDGYRVMTMEEASYLGDIFITVTGCINVIRKKHMLNMKNHAVMMNSGHFNNEINIEELDEISIAKEMDRENITTYKLEKGKELYLLTDGRLVNLAAGEGHAIEIIDLSFSIQFLALLYLLQNGNKLDNALLPVPSEIDEKVAKMNLNSKAIKIDSLTVEQKEYLKNTGK